MIVVPTLYDLTDATLSTELEGTPSFRRAQVLEGIYRQNRWPEEITNLPRTLREQVSRTYPRALEEVSIAVTDDGATIKWLYELDDGARIETVLMHYPNRVTVCVSTQAGCAMGCTFCATGQGGFRRHLSTGEIVEQVMRANRYGEKRRVSHVVFMGMGEPLSNYTQVVAALNTLNHSVGISARRLTVSTVGIIPAIRRLADENLPITLAISLHAANDTSRSKLLPINRRYPLGPLIDACHHWQDKTKRRITFEWALIDGVNDRDQDMDELTDISLELGAHVNLIPLNPTPGYPVAGSPASRVREVARRLSDFGVAVTVRDTRGSDIDAACGQLAQRSPGRVTIRRGHPGDPPTVG
ncbi:MAG: 23S rRNA (adenine(2503)-C(2))-methyltransferase RlmN [Ferrimicrobium sp.]